MPVSFDSYGFCEKDGMLGQEAKFRALEQGRLWAPSSKDGARAAAFRCLKRDIPN